MTKESKTEAIAAMAETPSTGTPAKAKGRRGLAVRLAPVENSDQPVLANYTSVNVAPGMAFIDFGFIEPGMLSALPRLAKQGGKLPEAVDGKLAVRVAMGYDGLANMYQQIGQVLKGLNEARAAAAKK